MAKRKDQEFREDSAAELNYQALRLFLRLAEQLGQACTVSSKTGLGLSACFLVARDITLQALLFFLEIVDLHQQMLRHLTPGALMVSGLALQVVLCLHRS